MQISKHVFLVKHDVSYIVFTLGIYNKKDKANGSLTPLVCLFFRYFCVYAALTVTFSYLMIVTYFVAIMSYDVKRIKAGRRDCLPFCRAPPPRENAPAWDEPRLQTSNKLMEAWARFLTSTRGQSLYNNLLLVLSSGRDIWCYKGG